MKEKNALSLYKKNCLQNVANVTGEHSYQEQNEDSIGFDRRKVLGTEPEINHFAKK